MDVLRVRLAAPITSFRYPHFLIGKQVTYDAPPPSTVYGQVAAALGELPDPASFRFAYHFSARARASDLEHQHVISAGGAPFLSGGEKFRTSTQGVVQPHQREFLFQPRLTLYLDRPDWFEAFRSPAFCVSLGRSQDLAEITECERIALVSRPKAYFERTLLPFSLRPILGIGTTVTMSRYIAPPPMRQASFAQYISLRERAYAGEGGEVNRVQRFLDPPASSYWIDPDSSIPSDQGFERGIWFHSFTD
jgi:CRISPR-associated protein Cas5t